MSGANDLVGLKVDRNGGVLTITINRAHRKNAIDLATFEEFRRVIDEAARTASDRVVVITGAEGVFSSGGDVTPHTGPDGEPRPSTTTETLSNVVVLVGEAVRAIAQCPKPVIAVVDGYALGAGFALALACDLVLATPSAKFGLPFIKHGLSVDAGTSWLLPRVVGMQRAKELAFLGRWLTAADAHDLGIVNAVLESDALADRLREWTQSLVAASPAALMLMKRGFASAATSTLDEALTMEGLSQVVATRAMRDER